jgi:hypothetical protein
MGHEAMAIGLATSEFGWEWGDVDALAGAAVAGRILANFATTYDPVRLPPSQPSIPIATLHNNGAFEVDWLVGGDSLSIESLRSLLIGIGNPDVTCDVAEMRLETVGSGMRIAGARGQPPVDFYDVEVVYLEGYAVRSVVELASAGAMADELSAFLQLRMCQAGCGGVRVEVRALGDRTYLVSASDHKQAVVDRFAHELARLCRMSPQLTGPIRQLASQCSPELAHWHARVPRKYVDVSVDCRIARDWM